MPNPSPTRIAALIFAAVFLAQFALGLRSGLVKRGGDTSAYLVAANEMIAGNPVTPRHGVQCRGFTALLALFVWSGLGFTGLVLFQIFTASLVSATIFLMLDPSVRRVSAFAASFAYAFHPALTKWHTYLLTDSLFASLLVLLLATSLWASQRGGTRYALPLVFCLFLVTFRPHGWVLPPTLVVYWHFWGVPSPWKSVAQLILTTAGIAAVAYVVGGGHDTVGFADLVRSGVVIYGYPNSFVEMPIAREGQSLLAYVVSHPAAVLKLAIFRLWYTLSGLRPYFSSAHNALTIASLFPAYLLAAWGSLHWKSPAKFLLVTAIGFQLGLDTLTWADWDGRFLSYLLPLIFVLAAAGLSPFLETISRWQLGFAHASESA